MATLKFPDGTTVQAVGLYQRREEDPMPDYGLYLDDRWQPTWNARIVAWEDFGLPANPVEAAEAICDAFARARGGQRVEIGCYAGIGRTGTVLACMAVLAGVPASEAVRWVRTHYHVLAVATPDQSAWVEWFAGHRHERS